MKLFSELTIEDLPSAGGKGGNLARLFQAGYPVPNGFVILPEGFIGENLSPEAWDLVKALILEIRRSEGDVSFAVRSSALSEDSAQASFAGEFETVLDASTDEEVWEAIHRVHRSRKSKRVQAYSEAHGLDASHELAVVVQRMVHAGISGVLFTADPVTGSPLKMMGNFVHGLGDQLVSGETTPDTFELNVPEGRYAGPSELKRFAPNLFSLASSLEEELGGPQDIEWAIVGDDLFLLQSRPITTGMRHNPATGEWNDSLGQECLWTSQGIGEIIPEVMTPATWSVWQIFYDQYRSSEFKAVGNICGRPYMNYSLFYSLIRKLGRKHEQAREELETKLGRLPDGIDFPLVPISMKNILTEILPLMIKTLWKARKLRKKIPESLAVNPRRCCELRQRIEELHDKKDLASLWFGELKPLFEEMTLTQDSANDGFYIPYTELNRELSKLIGEEETDRLLSTIRSRSARLASLGPLIGLSRLARGEISREEYVEQFGHRGPLEDMISKPSLAEDPKRLDEQLAEYREFPIDMEKIFVQKNEEYDAAWGRFQKDFPENVEHVNRKMDKIVEATVTREAVRSELTRVISVIRAFFLRAGELTGLGDDVFFLTWQELIDVLSKDRPPTRFISARKENYERYSALPPYPMLIIGPFDPFRWAADPDRRNDVYDFRAQFTAEDTDVIKGYPGSAGRVEGVVRRIDSPDEEDELQRGEILVTKTTNIGWTPLFPRIAAVITDIGAPLSHAAIVARELGIPAIVGCGNATTRLRTGDRVRVDGGRGVVEVLEQA